MFQITIPFLYLFAGAGFALGRLPQHESRSGALTAAAFALCAVSVALHVYLLTMVLMPGGVGITLATAVSLIGLQLGVIAFLSALNENLRGVSAGMLLLAAVTSMATGTGDVTGDAAPMTWQIRTHVLTSMFAYGLLTVGAIVAIYALIQDRRLRAGRLTAANYLFAPLDTTEKLLFALTAAGFTVLAFSIVSGITFVEDLFAQHLVHKTALSLVAVLLFGILLAGRQFAGWRGRQAIYLYLAAFTALGLSYFGSRFILEEVLGRSWG
ncbi:MAG: cytochrome c biogenesis protein CcsA [Woeseiaceae bacterium]|nr:cytochrome c biogenesis protein CcsA [Woeseiaceae bacterium]